jgi:hypothetical protein
MSFYCGQYAILGDFPHLDREVLDRIVAYLPYNTIVVGLDDLDRLVTVLH